MQCFDVKTLELLDEVSVSKHIQQLCFSPTCAGLAVGTQDGAVLTANALMLSTSLQQAINHFHAELIGLDVLCPGSDHCVVSQHMD